MTRLYTNPDGMDDKSDHRHVREDRVVQMEAAGWKKVQEQPMNGMVLMSKPKPKARGASKPVNATEESLQAEAAMTEAKENPAPAKPASREK